MSGGWADGFALLPMPLLCENSAVSLLKRGGLMDQAEFVRIVENAAMAPSVHNAQPARWRLVDGQIWVAHDLIVQLPHADPTGDGIGAPCGGDETGASTWLLLGFGALWPWLHLLGRTSRMTAQSDFTLTAPILACFHRPKTESPVTSGCAYLRFWLEATSLGLAGWPMAGLTDDADARSEICAHHSIPQDHKLIQVIRLGQPTGPRPPQARRPLSELIP